MLQSALPTTREPLQPQQLEDGPGAFLLVAVQDGICLDRFEQTSGPIELVLRDEPDRVDELRAVVEERRAVERLLDLDAPLEQSRCDLQRLRLDQPDPPERDGKQ